MVILNKKETFKEKIDLKKEFVKETLAFENKIFFAAVAFVATLALFVFQHPEHYNGWWVLAITFLFFLLETAIQTFRVKKFNEIMQEIDNGKVSQIQMRPINYQEQHTVVQKTISKIEVVKSEDSEIVRLTIVALLIAIMFGILQIFPEGKTFDSVGIGPFLKATATTSLYLPFILFGGYLLLAAHNARYKKKMIFLKLQAFFYDVATILTIYIVLLAGLFLSCVALLVKYPHFPMGVIVSVLWVFMLIGAVITYLSIKNHLPWIKK